MPLRIRAYIALAQERYNLSVYPVLINILPNAKIPKIPNFYELEFRGIRAYQSYQVINLWEIEANLVFKDNLFSLLPFVPILKGEQQGEANLLIRQLSRRFGNLDQAITLKIRELKISQLEDLGVNLFDFSNIDDLYNWLKQNS